MNIPMEYTFVILCKYAKFLMPKIIRNQGKSMTAKMLGQNRVPTS